MQSLGSNSRRSRRTTPVVTDLLLQKEVQSWIAVVEHSEVLVFLLGEIVFHVGTID
jgi:hypothetical protein